MPTSPCTLAVKPLASRYNVAQTAFEEQQSALFMTQTDQMFRLNVNCQEVRLIYLVDIHHLNIRMFACFLTLSNLLCTVLSMGIFTNVRHLNVHPWIPYLEAQWHQSLCTMVVVQARLG